MPNPGGGLLFEYANTASKENSESILRIPGQDALEGKDADRTFTKVVDRRWYERNKHIFPASMWREYEPGEEFLERMSKIRRDAGGNALFFS